MEQVALLTRKLGRFPTIAEMRLERRGNTSFPSSGAVERLGAKGDLIAKLQELCAVLPEFRDIAQLLPTATTAQSSESSRKATPEDGYVYLIQAGRYYKVGRTNALGRREREITLQLPDRAETVHVIRTDDPIGIEAYWHRRFEAARRNGEWFELSRDEVHAFKRRKFM